MDSKTIAVVVALALAVAAGAAFMIMSQSGDQTPSEETEKDDPDSGGSSEGDWNFSISAVDMSKWQYKSSSDVYWQVGISYCANPADSSYETLGIFVPGEYFDAVDNGDGTYTCTVNETGTVNGYTAETAPILFPVNTAGHKAQSAPTGFVNGATKYTDEGFVYVLAGCRGKDVGAPAGVTDLKAAIRYVRANLDDVPGCTDRVVAFGHSGGGSQVAVLGSSGNSSMYDPYLKAIGAADGSDEINAAMCWCPITSFDTSDEGYEWNMGMTRSGLSDEFQSYSDALAEAYAEYINSMGFKDEDGTVLTLSTSTDGIYQAGTYYEYVKRVIEESIEHYLVDTVASSKSYGSAQDYIDELNEDGEWVEYDPSTGTVTIASIADFSERFKNATKPVAAFDKLTEGGHELFNTGDGDTVHFDRMLYEIIKGSEYEDEFASDLALVDSVGMTIDYRVKMFSPLYYLMSENDGYGTSDVADHWRIRSGIEQSDTALTTEINLYLALSMMGIDADFETVWDKGHTQAERTGSSDTNFIEWVNSLW